MLRLVSLTAIVLLLQLPAQALELISVSPSRAEPETLVTLSGGPFTGRSQVLFGNEVLRPNSVESGQMAFIVPALPAGKYALRVSQDGQQTRQFYNFEVLEPTPRIDAITPRNIDACFDISDQTIQVEGRGFLPGTIVLFNGLTADKRITAANKLEFTLIPGLRAGVYGVQLKNPSGATSLPHSVWVSDIPTIYSVERGEDFVNHYEVIVRGKNFYFDSILTVTEPENELPKNRHQPLILHAHDSASGSSAYPRNENAGHIIYRDCRTLIYQRYPTSFQEKELLLQVINPDGKKTAPFTISLP